MNIYRGCTHGCIYCDSRSDCYGFDHRFEDIAVKQNAPELLENALRRKRKPCMIGTGAMCDPYMHCEESLGYTRKCLEIIDKYDCGVAIQTKSARILRDIDLLEKINRHSKAVVQITLTTYDENLCRIIEPNVSTTKQRYEVLKECQRRGILGYCFDAGVIGIINFGFGVTMRSGNREYFYGKLDEHFTGMKERYIKRFGDAYECPSDNSTRLWSIFRRECLAHGVMQNPGEIFAYMNEYPTVNKQMSLFDF